MNRFVKSTINIPQLLLKCPKDILPQSMDMNIKSPCSTSSNILNFDELKNIENCLWAEVEFIVRILYSYASVYTL